jgi:hypothetical protein
MVCQQNTDAPFFLKEVTKTEKCYTYFKQYSTPAHTAEISVPPLQIS